ncbi:MAG: large conductance mechanosensitive channel protein MscL [Ruminococcus sp.]|nr:large conductance mechanosensitive channel protein MscL [Ruminococcus sp.]
MFKKFMTEFKEFALKGNVMDMAIGVIIGAAFGNIVTSLTENFINPLIALITGGAKKDPETGVMQVVGGKFTINNVDFNYGSFISAVINFLVIALILFIMLKAVNGAVAKAAALAKKEEEAEEEAAEPSAEEKLLTEIRDLMASQMTSDAKDDK